MTRAGRRGGGGRWSGRSGTYRFALRVFGPAQLRPHGDVTPVTEADEARETQLHETLERVQRADGSWYVVTRRN
ncbi:hypothetical protein C8046_00535 [Serinibacter arcticus]|uniref:Uncharacterized protein n=1 Tax=Serinibacter arcticus TaxID=1655435 RepID=A0A2U1ZR10_9MICO|nr:hypothetical protein [Serinibacter arcticus]PWD49429.1 hypothetical protein C8046_00535 [Serinibacter arcticus]